VHPHAHHQELINCSSSLWFTVWNVVVAVLLVVVGPTATNNTATTTSAVAAAATLNTAMISRVFEISRVVYRLLRSNDGKLTIYPNKSTNQMHRSLRFTAYRLITPQHVSGILMPIIRSLSTAIAASGLPFGTWW